MLLKNSSSKKATSELQNFIKIFIMTFKYIDYLFPCYELMFLWVMTCVPLYMSLCILGHMTCGCSLWQP